MKRLGILLGTSFVATMIIGCDSGGIKEGPPTEPANPQPSGFQAEMERTSKNMTLKGARPKDLPGTSAKTK